MKKTIITLSIILLGFTFATAQRQKTSPEFDDKKGPEVNNEKNTDNNAGQAMDDVLLESGTSLDAQLISTLDVKKAKVGDEVVLKTTKSIKQGGDVAVPKGTKLIGRITEVQRKTKENSSSRISMVFENLQNKDLTAPINASIVSIASARGNLQAGDLFSTDAAGSSRSTASSGRSSGGGGLLGGATSTVGGVLNTTTSTVGGVTDTVGSTAGSATNTLGRTVNGVQILQSTNASASGSSTLSAENKNIRLEKGTQFQLQLNESVRN